jgi:hypothetical protein
MEIITKTRFRGGNNSETKKRLDSHFATKRLTVLPDADLLLFYISKKIDLEIELKKGSGLGRHIRRVGRSRNNPIIKANQGINKLASTIVEQSSNNVIDIESVRSGLKKLCPLWPIC